MTVRRPSNYPRPRGEHAAEGGCLTAFLGTDERPGYRSGAPSRGRYPSTPLSQSAGTVGDAGQHRADKEQRGSLPLRGGGFTQPLALVVFAFIQVAL